MLVGVAVLWFTVIRDKHKPPTEQPKTMAELLVGKWRLVKYDAGLPAGFKATIEYTKEGRVTMWVDNPLEDMADVQTGSYWLEGNTLRMTMDPPAGPRDRTMIIDSITEDKLIETGWIEKDRHVHEFERIREK